MCLEQFNLLTQNAITVKYKRTTDPIVSPLPLQTRPLRLMIRGILQRDLDGYPVIVEWGPGKHNEK
jgi:hypothetical protein